MDNHQKDLLACLKVETMAILKGAIVSRPTTDFARYDRVLDWNGKLYRAQIKFASIRAQHCQGAIALSLSKGNRAFYSREEIDALLVYIPQTDNVYWFGPEVFHGRLALQIRLEPPRNNQRRGCLMAEDYLW